jgi:hypothetical protein
VTQVPKTIILSAKFSRDREKGQFKFFFNLAHIHTGDGVLSNVFLVRALLHHVGIQLGRPHHTAQVKLMYMHHHLPKLPQLKETNKLSQIDKVKTHNKMLRLMLHHQKPEVLKLKSQQMVIQKN